MSGAPLIGVGPINAPIPHSTSYAAAAPLGTPTPTWKPASPLAPTVSLPTKQSSNPYPQEGSFTTIYVPTTTPQATLPAYPPGSPLGYSAISSCTPYQCNIFYQYVSVYYWADQNTACPPGPGNIAPTALPGNGGKPLQSPSIYAVFPSIEANNGCTTIGSTYNDVTATLAPGELSTVDGSGVTRVFDFSNLPCGARPTIAPPQYFSTLDPAFRGCIAGLGQGIDPSEPIPTAVGISPP